MVYLTWSIHPSGLGSAAVFGLLLSLVTLASPCPSDLASSARSCFSVYNVKLHSMKHNTHKLCCGLDVEELRAFCKAYVDGMRCSNSLRVQCPPEKQRMIDSAMVSLEGAKDSLNALCLDDRLVEKYAMFQTCYRNANSEKCFATHLHSSAISFLEPLGAASNPDFCRKMKATVACVQQNVAHCGQGADILAATLVKPMVRHSTDCDYSVDVGRPQQGPRQPYQSNPAYISDDGSSSNSNNRGGSGRSNNANKRRGSDKGNVASHQRPSLTPAVALFVSLLFSLHWASS